MDNGPVQSPRVGGWICHCLLLFAAAFLLSGAALAQARKLPKKSVGTKQLKNGAVHVKKLRNGAVNAKKVKKDSLTGAQIREPTLGTVPSAAHAATADRAGSSDRATIAAHAATSDRLAGLPAAAFQLRVTGTCAGGAAIGSVASNGTVGCVSVGGAPSGPAGGALSGTYPNPTLNVGGGPCPNGEAVIDVSSLAELSCALGVYLLGPSENLAVSPSPFPALTSGEQNSAFGLGTLLANSVGEANSAFGQSAISSNTTGSNNSALGQAALSANTTGSNNATLGQAAMAANLSGSNNSAVGQSALQANTTGANNSAVGQSALSQGTGNNNSALGQAALSANTGGSNNSAVGQSALAQSTGGNNSALGQAALSQSTGANNSAVGQAAMLESTSGEFNSALGQGALFSNTTGSNNAALGQNALFANTTGTSNTALGRGAGQSLTTGDNNIDIGNNGVAGESDTVRIGTQGTQSRAFLAGVSGATTEGVAAPVLVDASGQLGTTSSSRRFKQDIRPVGSRARGLMALRPVSFRYRGSARGALQFGLIAEQVAEVFPNLVVYGRDGRPSAVAYQELPALLLAQAQRQQAQLRRQREAIRALRKRARQIDGLRARVRWLMRHVGG